MSQKHRLVMISGDEEALRRRELAAVLESVGMDKEDFDLQSLSADTASPLEWIAEAGTAPFLAERRLVIVRNLLRAEPEPSVAKALAALPPTALLVLVADDEAGSDDKIQRMKTTVRNGWEKLVNGADGSVRTFNPDPKKAKDGLLQEAARMGRTLTPQAADILVEMTGGSLTRALEEFEKLALFVGGNEKIKESDVREVVVPSREWNVFRMVEATLEGRIPEALKQLRALVASAAKAEETAFRSILPTVSNQLRLVWQARLLIDAGKHAGNAPPEIAAQFSTRPNLLKEKDWRQNRVMAMARQTSIEKLSACFQILSDADSRLKGMLDGFSAMETLEMMVLEMSGTIGKQGVRR